MSDFPFEAWYWVCDCGAKMPKRTLSNMLFDPVEYLTCLKCDREYDGREPEEGLVRWLWKCGGCGGKVSWKEDLCHNPACGRPWLAGCPPKLDGGKPTYYPPEYEEPTDEELEDRAKGKPHRPLPGCPEVCKYRHVFELAIEPERDVGCVRAPLPVFADLRPPIPPSDPKGVLRWTIEGGAEVATFAGGATTHETHGADLRVELEAIAPKPSKFEGGTVQLRCEWNYGGPADLTYVARKRLAWHAGVTPDCPDTCPEIPVDDVTIDVKAFGETGWRSLDAGPLCPGEDVELAVQLTPPIAAEVRWTLLDADGKPLDAASDAAAAFLGVGLLGGRGTTFEGLHDDTVRLRHARGEWTGADSPVEVTLGGRLERGWVVVHEVAPAKLRVEVTADGETKERTLDLRWHGVSLEVEAAWFATGDAPGTVQLMSVAHLDAADAEHEGAYISVQASHKDHTPFCERLVREYAWKAQVTRFEGAPTEPCLAAANCLQGRWGAGFVQAHGAHERWWKYERAASEAGGPRWLKTVSELPPMPLCDSRAGAPRPWHEAPAVLEQRLSTADDSPFRAGPVEPVADAPWAHAAWREAWNGREYELRTVTFDDAFQTSLTVGLSRLDGGGWRELAPLAHLRWRMRLVKDVREPAGTTRADVIATSTITASDVSVPVEALLGRPTPNDAERLARYPSETEPTDDAPSLEGVRVVSVTLAAPGGKVSPSNDDELSLDEPAGEQLHFAPGHDPVEARFEIEAPPGVVPAARLEVWRQDDDAWPLWSRSLTPTELQAGVVQWDGKVEGSTYFPGGYVTLEHSPYDLRLVLPDVQGAGRRAWTRFRVVLADVVLEPAPADTVEDRRLQSQLMSAGDLHERGEHTRIRLFLPGDVFSTDSSEWDGDQRYQALAAVTKKDPEVPLLAVVRLKGATRLTADEFEAVDAPLGVGRVRIVWDVEDAFEVERNTLSCGTDGHEGGTTAESYVRQVETYDPETGLPPGTNAPALVGGKRGSAQGRLLQLTAGYPPEPHLRKGVFPFSASPLSRRPWAVVTATWDSGRLAGRAGVLLRPSRMAGDAYRLTAVLALDEAAMRRLDAPGALAKEDLPHAMTQVLQVWREVRVVGHLRKESNMNQRWSDASRSLAAGYMRLIEPHLGVQKEWRKAEYDARFLAARIRTDETKYLAATARSGHFDDGRHAVKTRTYDEYVEAHAELLGLPTGAFELSPMRTKPEKYPKLCKEAAKALTLLAFDDVLSGYDNGLVVLQWEELETTLGSLLGTAPSLGSSSRRKAAVFMFSSSVADFIHELGHQLFLPHAPQGPPDNKPEGAIPDAHDPSDTKCMMGYFDDSDHPCGMCALRLRGWSKYAVHALRLIT